MSDNNYKVGQIVRIKDKNIVAVIKRIGGYNKTFISTNKGDFYVNQIEAELTYKKIDRNNNSITVDEIINGIIGDRFLFSEEDKINLRTEIKSYLEENYLNNYKFEESNKKMNLRHARLKKLGVYDYINEEYNKIFYEYVYDYISYLLNKENGNIKDIINFLFTKNYKIYDTIPKKIYNRVYNNIIEYIDNNINKIHYRNNIKDLIEKSKIIINEQDYDSLFFHFRDKLLSNPNIIKTDKRCDLCNGTGKVSKRSAYHQFSDSENNEVMCIDCIGTGYKHIEKINQD